MKKYLIEQKKYYKASLHTHTTRSDGYMSPEEVKASYQKLGYDIVAFTDHTYIEDFNSYLTDDKFVAINGYENCILPIDKKEDYNRLEMPLYHLNFYSTDKNYLKLHGINSVDFDRWQTYKPSKIREQSLFNNKCSPVEYSVESINQMIKEANEHGLLVQYNHPKCNLHTYNDYIGLKGLWGVEVFNYDSTNCGYMEFNDHIVDDLYKQDQRFCVIASDDAHDWNTIGLCCNYIGASELTYEGVIDAMKRKDLYASCGPTFEYIYIENGKIYIKCSAVRRIVMLTDIRLNKTINFGEDKLTKTVNKNVVGTDCELWFPDGAKYLRFVIEDIYGNRAWTRAYFADECL